MADFCNMCADRLAFGVDIDIPKIAKELPPDHFEYVLCEGCELMAVGKFKGIIKLAYPSKRGDGHIEWVDYKRLLWLDDVRDPWRHKEWIATYAPDYSKYSHIIWVKNYKEFTEWIESNGLPDYIAFDHDLADEHYHPSMFTESGYDDLYPKFKEKTGLDCARWISEYCSNNHKMLPDYSCHSQNPVGSRNILSYLSNAKKHLNI